jgi:hypothetical protein
MSAAAGMVLVAFGMLAFVGCGGWLVWRAREQPTPLAVALAAATTGAAAFLVVLLVSGLRSFGGACAEWWVQIDSVGGVESGTGAAAPSCRQAAVNAVDPTLVQAALVTLAWVALVAGYLAMRRRGMDSAAG